MSHKLQVKLGVAEFSAEGEEEAVKQQFEAFLAAIKAVPVVATPAPTPAALPTGQNGTPPLPEGPILSATMQRIFTMNEDRVVSLRVLPRTDRRDADALVLLLYGFRELANEVTVGSNDLMEGARQSGLQLARLDHPLIPYRHLITEGGLRRGKRYGLNNQGANHAEQLIAGIL